MDRRAGVMFGRRRRIATSAGSAHTRPRLGNRPFIRRETRAVLFVPERRIPPPTRRVYRVWAGKDIGFSARRLDGTGLSCRRTTGTRRLWVFPDNQPR